MSAVRFSVVIPTRERAGTLRYALRTCLDQQFDDYEVVVSDNFSSPATKAVVDEARSPKVRYVRTPEPLALTDSWEFGLSHARGEYVLLIGDDDGVLPHGLNELDALLRETRAKALRWDAVFYTWPTVALEGQGDYLRVPMGQKLVERRAREVIPAVVAGTECYTELPMVYNAAVHRDVLDELRARTGRVFPHQYPDVYSGMAVAHVVGSYFSTTVPMTVSGQSGASTGVATLFNRGGNPIEREFNALNAKTGFHPEPTVPDLPVFPEVPVADCFVFGKRTLFPDIGVELDRRRLARACVTRARVREADWPATLAAVRASLGDAPGLQAWFDAELAGTPYRTPPPLELRPARLGFDGRHLHLDAATFDVTDVAGAVRLSDQLLNYRDRRVEYVPTDDFGLAARKVTELQRVCNEREQAVLRLHLASAELQRACDERLELITRLARELESRERVAIAEREQLARRLVASERWSVRRPLVAVRNALRTVKLLRRAG
ncbi:MAG TPA: glycosyltransferase family 2 protein [Gemmata sp.]